MNRPALPSALPLLFALTLAPTAATAGVVIQMEAKGAQDAQARPMTLWIGADRVRIDGPDGSYLFRGDKQLVWVIQSQDKSYMELTGEQAQKMAGMMAEAQAQLANLPPEQRAMVQQMMAAHGGGPGMAAMGGMPAAQPPAPPAVFTRTGKSETVNGWACTAYDVTRAGQREQEMWVTAFSDFGLKPEDFAACQQLAEFMKKLGGPFAKQLDAQPFARKFGSDPDGVPGVPIRVVDLKNGSTNEIKKVTRQDIPASEFELPAGLTRQAMPGM